MKIKKVHGLGNHLIVDGFCNGDIDSVEFIRKFLLELVEKVKMRAISKPFVLYHEAEDKSESGVTGIIILAESNISIHTYPYKKMFFLDVFSCKEFNVEDILEYLIKKLKIFKFNKQLLKRELKWKK